jgi:hypothetical protein
MPPALRYTGSKDTALRFALLKAWAFKCYWCGRLIGMLDSEIDHILARAMDDEALAREVARHGLPVDFHRDDVANLAPICSACNKRKGNRGLSAANLTAMNLDHARNRADGIVRDVRSIRAEPKLAEFLTRITESDPSDPRTKALLETFGAAVMRKIVDAGVALESHESLALELDSQKGVFQEVEVALDTDGIATRKIVEEICGSDWHQFVTDCVVALVEYVARSAVDKVEGVENDAGEPVNSGEAEFLDWMISIDRVKFDWQQDSVTFRLQGEVQAFFACSAVRYADDGSGLLELQGEGEILARFEVHADYSVSDPGYPIEVQSVELDDDRSDVWIN